MYEDRYEYVSNVIRASKFYSKYDLEIKYDTIIYKTKNHSFTIYVEIDSYKIKFTSEFYRIYDIEPIKVTMENCRICENKVLLKFGEIIRNLNKVIFFLDKKEEHKKKIEPILVKYIKDKFDIDFYDNDKNHINLTFCRKSYYTKAGRYFSSNVDTRYEKKNKFDYHYDIYVNCVNEDFKISVKFRYTNKLIYVGFDKHYDNKKNITNIIRSERLKNLINA